MSKVIRKPFFSAAINKPEVIAHRGGGGEWPGETMYAFERAIKLGVDVLEMDVRLTKDNEIVLMHNGSVDKTTDGTGCVRHLTMDQLSELKAAARWGANPEFQDIRIAKLSDVINLLRREDEMRANIEIKPRDLKLALKVCDILTQEGLKNRVLVASAFSKVLKPFRKEGFATSASVFEIFLFQVFRLIGLTYKLEKKTDAIQWHSRMLGIPVITKSFVEKAKSQGLIVHAWTVNEPEEMARMIKLKVHAIITDYPTILMKILNRLPKQMPAEDEFRRHNDRDVPVS